jgi:type I restriction enzyme S subunit
VLPDNTHIPWDEVRIYEIADELSERCGDRTDITVLSCTKHEGLVDSLAYFGKQVFGNDLSNYKVVHSYDFAYATNHIEEGSIGLLTHREMGLVSPMYTVFRTRPAIHDRFLYWILKSEHYRQHFESLTSASVDRRGGLRWAEFSAIKIPFPPFEEQRAIADILDTSQEEIDLLMAMREQIQRQKRGLMQKLLTGQIRVPVHADSEETPA